MRTKLLTTGFLLLALAACKDKQPESTPPPSATPPAAPARRDPPPPPAEPAAAAPQAAPAETPATTESREHAATPAPRSRPPAEKPGPWQQKALRGQEIFATLQTNQGNIVVKLYSKDAPLTVANFVGLSNGEQAWQDVRSGQVRQGKPLYEKVVFHRVIPGFMIQGGDPEGTGRGSPGYTFEDETMNGRTFNKPGLLAMANRGPRTNGSQFFITVSNPDYLNGKHTIFGEVVQGYEVVERIAGVPTFPGNRPQQDVVLQKVVLSDTGPQK